MGRGSKKGSLEMFPRVKCHNPDITFLGHIQTHLQMLSDKFLHYFTLPSPNQYDNKKKNFWTLLIIVPWNLNLKNEIG